MYCFQSFFLIWKPENLVGHPQNLVGCPPEFSRMPPEFSRTPPEFSRVGQGLWPAGVNPEPNPSHGVAPKPHILDIENVVKP